MKDKQAKELVDEVQQKDMQEDIEPDDEEKSSLMHKNYEKTNPN